MMKKPCEKADTKENLHNYEIFQYTAVKRKYVYTIMCVKNLQHLLWSIV